MPRGLGSRSRSDRLSRDGRPWHRRSMPASRTRTTAPPETALYGPVKALLEAQGYVVKGEITGCDVVGVRGDEPPVIVELKRTFGLDARPPGHRPARADRRRLRRGRAPGRASPRRPGGCAGASASGSSWSSAGARTSSSTRSRTGRAGTGAGRPGCSTSTGGGSATRPRAARSRRPIMTAYRQEALRCAGSSRPARRPCGRSAPGATCRTRARSCSRRVRLVRARRARRVRAFAAWAAGPRRRSADGRDAYRRPCVPALNPPMKLRRRSRNRTRGGTIAIAMPANVSPWSVA